jgi:hypothetical protein
LEQFYKYVWSSPNEGNLDLDQSTWEQLLVPGVRDGSFLKYLPSTESVRPMPSPAVLLEHSVTPWCISGLGTIEECQQTNAVVVFATHDRLLLELRVHYIEGQSLIRSVYINKVVSLREQFLYSRIE